MDRPARRVGGQRRAVVAHGAGHVEQPAEHRIAHRRGQRPAGGAHDGAAAAGRRWSAARRRGRWPRRGGSAPRRSAAGWPSGWMVSASSIAGSVPPAKCTSTTAPRTARDAALQLRRRSSMRSGRLRRSTPGDRAIARITSARLTMPTSLPSRRIGTRLMRCWAMSSASSVTPVVSPALTIRWSSGRRPCGGRGGRSRRTPAPGRCPRRASVSHQARRLTLAEMNGRIRSPSLTMPSKVPPASQTGTALMLLSDSRRATCATVSSGVRGDDVAGHDAGGVQHGTGLRWLWRGESAGLAARALTQVKGTARAATAVRWAGPKRRPGCAGGDSLRAWPRRHRGRDNAE